MLTTKTIATMVRAPRPAVWAFLSDPARFLRATRLSRSRSGPAGSGGRCERRFSA